MSDAWFPLSRNATKRAMSHIFTQARNAVIGRRARPITAALVLVALREIFTGACVALRYAGSGNHAGMSVSV